MKQLINIFFGSVFLLFSCNTNSLNEIPMEQFVGVWELHGREMYKNLQIEISIKDGKPVGKLLNLNDNKYINMFSKPGDIWISEITRSSNYQFRLKERKIARELFAIYGLSTSAEYKVEFIDENTIGLAGEGKDPQNATIKYIRVK